MKINNKFNLFKRNKEKIRSKTTKVTYIYSHALPMDKEKIVIVCERAKKILEDNNEHNPPTRLVTDLFDDTGRILFENVLNFANNYGCTLDYLLGRTDTPYYTI